MTPTTRAIGGTTYGSTVSVSTRPRALGMRRCTHIAVGSINDKVTTIAPRASRALSHNVVPNPGDRIAAPSGSSVQFLNSVEAPNKMVGTPFWKPALANISNGNMKYTHTAMRNTHEANLPRRLPDESTRAVATGASTSAGPGTSCSGSSTSAVIATTAPSDGAGAGRGRS